MDRRASLWMETEPAPVFPRLEGEVAVDVAVVGAGITGITAAALLTRAGARVAVLDMGRIAAGETARSTASLSLRASTDYRSIASKFGPEGARHVAESQRAAIETIAGRVEALSIDCGFQRLPQYLFCESGSDAESLADEVRAMRNAGVEVTPTSAVPVPVGATRAYELPAQAQLHPRRYLLPLARAIERDGGMVFERSRCVDVEDGEPCRVVTDAGVVRARDVVVATHVPISSRVSLHTKLAPQRVYVLAARTRTPPPPVLLTHWGASRYDIRGFRDATGDYLLVAGEAHHTGQRVRTEECYGRLEDYAQTHFSIDEVVYHWSGQIIEPADGLPFIGRRSGSEHLYVATGYGRAGITLGTVAGMLLTDAILERPNRWAAVYRANRVKPLAQARRALTENVDYAAHLIGDRVARGDVASSDEIPRGEGRLVRVGSRMAAVYCDTVGDCHYFSAVCPHLGCHVRWNDAEQSWDCPCHGSRFEAMGTVINGPATRDLERLPGSGGPGGEPASE